MSLSVGKHEVGQREGHAIGGPNGACLQTPADDETSVAHERIPQGDQGIEHEPRAQEAGDGTAQEARRNARGSRL